MLKKAHRLQIPAWLCIHSHENTQSGLIFRCIFIVCFFAYILYQYHAVKDTSMIKTEAYMRGADRR